MLQDGFRAIRVAKLIEILQSVDLAQYPDAVAFVNQVGNLSIGERPDGGRWLGFVDITEEVFNPAE